MSRCRTPMNLSSGFSWRLPVLAVLTVSLGVAAPRAVAQQPPAAEAAAENQDAQVLTRGPVHEAFAVPVVYDGSPGLVVTKAPPEPVEELPPDEKPAGENVQWVPGYWSWDQARNDFIWVSGIWREPPPGRQWVPGYWNQVAGGYQWVSGAWIPINQEPAPQVLEEGQGQEPTEPPTQAAYLPAPPASLEVGPNTPAPSTNEVFWTPGTWYWRDTRYVWRPGFWAAVQPNWVWVPAYYVWTPGGYLFVEGYWDLPVVNRGILFAPVYYPQPVYLQPRYVYTPTITIATSALVANLFVQPSYRHYCFGDYYDRSFVSAGILPWFSFTFATGPRRPLYYDPLFSYYSAINVRQNPRWATQVREEYILRRDNVALRPPRTYIEQTRIVQKNVNITNNITVINESGRRVERPRNLIMGQPISQLASASGAAGTIRMERLNQEGRRQWQERAVELKQFRQERLRHEVAAGGPRPSGPAAGKAAAVQPLSRPRPLTLPNSPIAARPFVTGRPEGDRTRVQRPATGRQEPSQPQGRVRPDRREPIPGATQPAGPRPRVERPQGQQPARPGQRPSGPLPPRATPGPRGEMPVPPPHGAGGPATAKPSISHPGMPPSTPATPKHPIRVGPGAPHDQGRPPGTRFQQNPPRHEMQPRSEPPRLHAPAQDERLRRPPPPPRPLPRQGRRPGNPQDS